jgi:hypothetical protein
MHYEVWYCDQEIGDWRRGAPITSQYLGAEDIITMVQDDPDTWVSDLWVEDPEDDLEEWAHGMAGYWYASCWPGCLPDSDWTGPFTDLGAIREDLEDLYDAYILLD